MTGSKVDFIDAASSRIRLQRKSALWAMIGRVGAPVRAAPPPPLACAERKHADLYVKHGAIVERLCAFPCLARPKDADLDLSESVTDHGASVRGALGRHVDVYGPQLVLPPPVGAVAAVVEYLYTRALEDTLMRGAWWADGRY